MKRIDAQPNRIVAIKKESTPTNVFPINPNEKAQINDTRTR